MMTLCLGYESGKTVVTSTQSSYRYEVLHISDFSFKQLEEAERRRIEDLKEKERQKVTEELELWKKQQQDAEKQNRIQKEGELHQEVEQLKEKKKEKINKPRVPSEGTSRTRLKPTKGCIIEAFYYSLKCGYNFIPRFF